MTSKQMSKKNDEKSEIYKKLHIHAHMAPLSLIPRATIKILLFFQKEIFSLFCVPVIWKGKNVFSPAINADIKNVDTKDVSNVH